MAFPGIADCSTQVADERLLYAGKYASYVHGLEEQSTGMYPTTMGTFEQKMSMISGLGCGADCNCPCNNKGVNGLGDSTLTKLRYNMWPPGPKPTPNEWNGWTLTLLDGKWMYQNPNDSRLYITPSNFYDLMGVNKDKKSGFPEWYPDANPISSVDAFKKWLTSPAALVVSAALSLISISYYMSKKERKRTRPKTGTRKVFPRVGTHFGEKYTHAI